MDDLEPDTAERLLRGEDTGLAGLAEFLAAAAAPASADPSGEEAAVAAFRRRRPRRRLFDARTVVIALLLALTGGVAATATAQHAPAPHPRGVHSPGTPAGTAVRTTPPHRPRPHPSPSAHPRGHTAKPHPGKHRRRRRGFRPRRTG